MRKTIGLVGLLVVLATFVPATGAQALSRTFWGVANGVDAPTGRDFTKMHRAKVKLFRISFFEGDIETAPGVFNWSETDRIVGNLARRGITTLPVLLVSRSNPPPPLEGADRMRWEQFVHEVVARYKPGGAFWHENPGLRSKPIRKYQVLNEPNLPKYFPSSHAVRDYAKMLNITHDAIRGAYPHAKVVLAGLAGFSQYRGWKFLNRLYRVRGVKRNFDIAAAHPYSPTMYYLRYQMKRFRRAMKHHGDGGTPLWLTEFGYGSARPNGYLNKGFRGQAKMLKKSFRLLRSERRRWKIYGVIWFQWRDPVHRNRDCTFCSSSGLLRSNYGAKPALRAFKHFARSAH